MLDLTSALAAAAKRDVFGTVFRVKWTVTDADDPSFTFTVHGCPMP